MKMPSKVLMIAAYHSCEIERLYSLTKCKECANCSNTCPFGFVYKFENGVMCQVKCDCAKNDPCKVSKNVEYFWR
jgi:hypothetical protein